MFESRVFGKFILTGEHTVLRGGSALVFPMKSKHLDIFFQEGPQSLEFSAEGSVGASELNLVFWSLMERALSLVHKQREEVTSKLAGKLRIQNNIPLGAGLGASAALCVGVGRWFEYLGLLPRENLFSFSKSLEDLFHGESSGVDVAAALGSTEIYFRRNEPPEPLINQLRPKLYLSSSGNMGKTSDCVAKVKALIQRDPQLGAEIDSEMKKSSEMALQALKMHGDDGLNLLADSMTKARSCFERWGLAEGHMQEHMVKLMESGARAVKPTGSGAGGYILSLWTKPPKMAGLLET